MEGDLLEVFIETEINTVVTEENNDDNQLNSYIISASALLLLAGAGAYYLASRGGEIDEGIPILVPLDEVNSDDKVPNENTSGAEEQTFKLLEGSQFSRELIFVCLGGCQKEFTSDNEDDEVMCPNCGMIGEAPQ